MASFFAPPASAIPASGVGTAGLDPSAIRSAFARGAGQAGAVQQQAAAAQYMSRLNPGDELKALQRESRQWERSLERQEKRDEKWRNEMHTRPNSDKTASTKLAEPTLVELLAGPSPEKPRPRFLDLLPFLGAAGGVYMSMRRPGGAVKVLGLDPTLPKATRVALGAGAGSTLGFLPGVAHDAHNAVFGKRSSYEEPVVQSLAKVAEDAFSLGQSAAMEMAKQSCGPMKMPMGSPGHDGDAKMVSSSLDSLAAQALELKKRVDRGHFKMPSWAEYKVYKAADAIKDALSSSFTMHKPKIRITIIKAAEEGAKLAAHSVLRAG